LVLVSIAMACHAAIPARADEVRVAVAANFTAPMKALAEVFERESGHRVVPAFGSTGALYAQIQNGAPFAVFLAADEERPRLLEEQGAAEPGTRFTYAVGQLALWSAKPGWVDERGAVLKSGRFAKLAIANPRTAPYGAAAQAALETMGLAESLRPKLVFGQDIGQAFQFVLTGNAELGLVALSQVLASEQARGTAYWVLPQSLYPPLRQQAVLLARARDHRAARALIRFLHGAEARAMIREFGYGLE
jgi:molybdate transport system substrate-binding protein